MLFSAEQKQIDKATINTFLRKKNCTFHSIRKVFFIEFYLSTHSFIHFIHLFIFFFIVPSYAILNTKVTKKENMNKIICTDGQLVQFS